MRCPFLPPWRPTLALLVFNSTLEMYYYFNTLMLNVLSVGSGSIVVAALQISLTYFEPDTSKKKIEIGPKRHAPFIFFHFRKTTESLRHTCHADHFFLFFSRYKINHYFPSVPLLMSRALVHLQKHQKQMSFGPALPVRTHLKAVHALHLSVPVPAPIDFPHSSMPVSAVRDRLYMKAWLEWSIEKAGSPLHLLKAFSRRCLETKAC